MKELRIAFVAILSVLAVGCKKKGGDGTNGFPANFMTMRDSERLEYMMRRVDPDSVARFLCYSYLGRVPGSKIDTLAVAHLYACDKYRGEDFEKYITSFEAAVNELPLCDKMHTQLALGTSDTLSVGYDLGLGYVSQIRTRGLTQKDIDADIDNLRKACGTDTATYTRFVKGFKTALQADRGKDLPNDIYSRYINLK